MALNKQFIDNNPLLQITFELSTKQKNGHKNVFCNPDLNSTYIDVVKPTHSSHKLDLDVNFSHLNRLSCFCIQIARSVSSY